MRFKYETTFSYYDQRRRRFVDTCWTYTQPWPRTTEREMFEDAEYMIGLLTPHRDVQVRTVRFVSWLVEPDVV